MEQEGVIESGGEAPEPEVDINEVATNAFREAFGGESVAPDETTEAPKGPARDAQGRFAPVQPAEGPAPETSAIPAGNAEVAPGTQDLTRAPTTWRPEAAATWATMPEAARAEAWRRESDYHAGLAPYREAATFGSELARALSPYADSIRQSGVQPAEAAAELFQFHQDMLAATPEQRRAMVDRIYGPGSSAPAPAQRQPGAPLDPRFEALERQLGQVTQFMQNQENQRQAAARAQAQADLQAFKADPKNIYYTELEMEMKRLFEANMARDLADAYEQASWRVPAVREKILHARTEAERAEAARKAQEAKAAAAVNLRTRGTIPGARPEESVHDAATRAYRESFGG